MCVHKKDICIPASQLDKNESNDFSTSTGTSITIQASPIIEERILLVNNNPYNVIK